MQRITVSLLFLPLLALQACATGPRFDAERYATTPDPREATGESTDPQGTAVLWGGIIINSSNLEEGTLIEVLAYPLDSAQRPQTDRSPHGRFLVFEERYLETVDYAQGRLLTVAGTITETRTGKVGEASYTYPLVKAEGLHLWPENGRTSRTRFNIGVGVIFSR